MAKISHTAAHPRRELAKTVPDPTPAPPAPTPAPAPAPAPTEPAQPKQADAAAFAARFKSVGEELDAYQAKHGADAAADLWARYRLIRYGDALASQAKRDAAMSTLAKLHAELAASR